MEFRHDEDEFEHRDTLLYVFEDEKVLMIEKDSGPRPKDFEGERFLNGPGGKIEDDETPLECAIRELDEEVNVIAENVEKVGEMAYYRDGQPERFIHIYTSYEYSGNATEGDEIPTWEPIKDLDYSEMWPSDEYWMPDMIDGEKFRTEVVYRNGDFIESDSWIENGVSFEQN